ncbi:zinc knuckle, partial [Colletotrichum abscissum]|uniref:zinc knuckle n=1 Tax=Colletotrichum abscissum TaxID=1671311 RepID=UPI0027D68109
MDDMNLMSQLRAGTITYEEGDRRTTIDLCLVTLGLVDRMTRCEVDNNINHDSDHLPIATSLNLAVTELQREEKRKWKANDKETFIETLRGSLPQLRRPRTKAALDGYVGKTIDALSVAIKTAVPTSTLSPKSRRGWDEQCAAILAETKRLRRDHSERQTEESWEAYRTARNRKGRIIKKALQQAHREAVETAAESPRSLWKIAKWARNRQSQPPTVTPEIRNPNTSQVAATPEEKAALFKETFFPPPPEANLEDIDNASYSNQIGLPPVSESKVEVAIQEAAPLNPWGEIKPKATCIYLGLIMDSALKWKQHIDETERKVTNTITALSSIGSSTWGVMTREMRTIYRGVAIPQMMYACSLWSNSGWGEMGYTKRTLNRLQRLQARAARTMCGAYRATSFPALDVEMHLLPVEQQIWKHNIDTISRVGMAEVTARRGKKISPRETITNRIRDGQDVTNEQHEHEHIPPFITPPWWQGPRIHIAGGTEQAEKEHERCLEKNTDAAHIYTDGSGIDGQIGAAAVCTTTQQTRKSHMGDDTTSTVYAGELQGIVLALEMAQADKENGNHRSKVFIHTDNQAAIRSS